jgi:prephenate dehydrogenase
MGGSFALALRRAGFDGRIVGVSSPPAIEEALRHNVIDAPAALSDAAAEADLIYLAQPIARIIETIPKLAPHLKPGALVTDAGSTKRAICAAAAAHLPAGQFLGGHPMAGKEVRGAGAADAALFEGRPYVLTPAPGQPMNEELLGWVRRIGARPVVATPEEHDRLVAASSHLPQLLSTALAALLAGRPDDIAQVAGPGLLDMTRLALSDYGIWRDILATNRAEILAVLDAAITQLGETRAALASSSLEEDFARGAGFAAALRRRE